MEKNYKRRKGNLWNRSITTPLRGCSTGGGDQWRWELDKSGSYSVASFRKVFDEFGLRRCGPPTHWFKTVPTKVRIFNWRLNLDRLPTKVNLLNKGVSLDNNLCSICHGCPETAKHIFVECPKVLEVRRLINAWWKIFSENGAGNQRQNVCSKKAKNAQEAVLYAFRWCVWKKRNEVIFNGASFIPSLLANDIQAMAFCWFHYRSALGSSVSWLDWSCSPSLL